MKKTYIYMVLAAAAVAVAVLAVSCVRELDIPRPEIGDNAVITLTPFCDDPVTKAEEPGDDTYNENLIADYYWFIYSDEAGSTLLKSGYTSGNGVTEIPLSDFPITSGNGWVYVIANLPQEPESPVAGDEWFEYDEATGGLKRVVQGGSTTAYAGTVTGETGLLTIDFGKSMPTSYTKSSEFYEYTSATTGVPKPEKFVMRTSTPVNFTIVNNTTNVEVPAHLERVAVKIILDLYVAESVIQKATTTDGSESYVKSWDSDISHIQIYMLWGSTRGNLAGTPYHYGDAGVSTSWFYSASPRYAMYTNPLGGRYDNATNSVAGSVPDNRYVETDYPVMTTVWDYVYVVNESQGDQGWLWNDKVPDGADDDWRDIHRGDYYYGNWAYIYDENNQKQIRTYVDEDDGQTKSERQSTTQTEIKSYYRISSLPLYTMPISWNVNEAHAPFIKVILPWQGYYEQAVDGHAVGERDPKTTEFYYKILIPELTTLDANGCYHIKLDLSVLGSTADEVPVELSGQYYVVAWNAPQMMGGDQSAGRYLDCATHFEFYSTGEMNIPIRSSHDVEIVGTPTATYNNYSQTTVSTGNLTYRTNEADTTGNNFTVKATGNNKVTVRHQLQSDLAQMASRDVSPITYTFTIQHKGDGGSAYQKTITVTQYPSMYIEAIPNTDNGQSYYSAYYGTMLSGNVYINNARYARPRDMPTADRWRVVVGIDPDDIGSATGNNNPNKYKITSSVLDPSLGFVLGDPRTDVIDNLNYTFATAPSIEGTNRSLQYYYPTEHNSSNESSSRTYNMVAPSFINASSFGKCGPSMTYDEAVRRCAAYQEDGYPAGRWRLPTRAELQYIATMSANSLIPQLYNDTADSTPGNSVSSIYWSAHGLKTITNGVVTDNTGSAGWVRCVYDDWYWGKDRVVNVTTFTWGDKQR